MPEGFSYIWEIFLDLNREREASLSIQSIKIRDIIAYMAAFRLRLTPFEIECVQAIDQEFLKAYGNSKS